MSTADTKIQWTDRTWNPVRGCSRVSPGCDNCYAMGQARRFAGPGRPYEGLTTLRNGKVDWSGVARFVPSALSEPLSWRKPQRVFVNSMSDLFHHSVTDEEIAAVFGVMAARRHLTFQVLTKRAKRMREWFEWVDQTEEACQVIACQAARVLYPNDRGAHLSFEHHCAEEWPLPNVHLGVSAENQETADERIPDLLATPAAVRFVSAEPLLGPTNLRGHLLAGVDPGACANCGRGHGFTRCPNTGGVALTRDHGTGVRCDRFVRRNGVHWVIIGGESGRGARPFEVAWARQVVEQCRSAGVPCFVKQLGRFPMARAPVGVGPGVLQDDLAIMREWPSGTRFGNQTGLPPWNGRQALLTDRKGGDMAEWSNDLRVRQFPGESA